MKRFLVMILMLAMVMSLAGCGDDSSASSTPVGSQQGEMAGADNTAEDKPAESTDSKPLETEPIETAPEDLPEASGIIVGAYTQTTSEFYLDVYCVSPENSTVQQLFTVNLAKNSDGTNYYIHGNDRFISQRGMVSQDLSKVVISKYYANTGEYHAGWLDRDGNFFDVTEALGFATDSDFATLPKQYAYEFTESGDFVFYDDVENKFYRVSSAYPTQENMIEGREMPECISVMGYPESGWQSYDYAPTDLIDSTHFLADYDYHRIDQKESVILNATTGEATSYVPGDARNSWSGTMSPDGQQIAFLSALRNVRDAETDLYITSASGGEPTKIDVTLPDSLTESHAVKYSITGLGTYVFIIDWTD